MMPRTIHAKRAVLGCSIGTRRISLDVPAIHEVWSHGYRYYVTTWPLRRRPADGYPVEDPLALQIDLANPPPIRYHGLPNLAS
jgi:hypothetical protein